MKNDLQMPPLQMSRSDAPAESRPDDGRDPVCDREAAVLLSALIHDIRTPLGAMAGWLEVLESQLPEAPGLVGRAIVGLRRGIASQTQVVNTMGATLSQLEVDSQGDPARRPFGPVLDRAMARVTDPGAEPIPAIRQRLALTVFLPSGEVSSLTCLDSGESLVAACCVMLEALAAAQAVGDPPIEIEVRSAAIRLRAPRAGGNRSAIRGLCLGLHLAGTRRFEVAPQALWLAHWTFTRCDLQLLLDEHPDGLCLTLTGIAHPDAQSSSLV